MIPRRLFWCALSLWALAAGSWAAPKPNLVVTLSDDMGFSDLGCGGGEIATPNLDALAAQGVRFSQSYNAARCCPTRASLLTGLHPHQTGVGHMMEDRGQDSYRGNLNRRCVTIANEPEYRPNEFYYTDAITDHAVPFPCEHARDRPHQPFFLDVAYTAAHWPMQAKASDIPKYRGHYDAGYAAIRQARLAKLQQLDLVPAYWVPAPFLGDWEQVKNSTT
jgi:arylsulfatase